jgi:hypothetical protein
MLCSGARTDAANSPAPAITSAPSAAVSSPPVAGDDVEPNASPNRKA